MHGTNETKWTSWNILKAKEMIMNMEMMIDAEFIQPK